MLMPIIGMAGLPFIQKKLLQKQLEDLKPKLLADLTIKLQEVHFRFYKEVENYVVSSISHIENETNLVFQNKSEMHEQALLQKLDQLHKGVTTEEETQVKYREALLQLENQQKLLR